MIRNKFKGKKHKYIIYQVQINVNPPPEKIVEKKETKSLWDKLKGGFGAASAIIDFIKKLWVIILLFIPLM